MVIQRGTEKFVLTPEFEKLVSTAFDDVSQEVEVSEISPVHPLFRCPIVTIKSTGEDLLQIIEKHYEKIHGRKVAKSPLKGPDDDGAVLASLTSSQQQVLEMLEKKSHILPSNSV